MIRWSTDHLNHDIIIPSAPVHYHVPHYYYYLHYRIMTSLHCCITTILHYHAIISLPHLYIITYSIHIALLRYFITASLPYGMTTSLRHVIVICYTVESSDHYTTQLLQHHITLSLHCSIILWYMKTLSLPCKACATSSWIIAAVLHAEKLHAEILWVEFPGELYIPLSQDS